LKCLIEHTQVSKATITVEQNQKERLGKAKEFHLKGKVDQEETDKVSAYCLSVSSGLHIWIVQSSLPERTTARKNNYTTPARALVSHRSRLDNQAH